MKIAVLLYKEYVLRVDDADVIKYGGTGMELQRIEPGKYFG